MAYVREHGYPVPAVDGLSDDGADLVLERIDGQSMVSVMGRRPWTLGQQGKLLAGLHHRLHEIPSPDWVPAAPCGGGDRLLHLDLHPLNVMIGEQGPVVIDWSNAARGDGDVDVALAWVLLASGSMPYGRVKAAVLGRGRALFVNSFLRACDRAAAARHLACVVEWKVKDPNMTEAERRTMRQLATSDGDAATKNS
jgi:tRNA A-37 threonylcarbamoyl transferase component Bud32